MFVVTGATGNTGAVVADQLLNAGKKVRVVARNAAKLEPFARRGAEVVAADLNDFAALARAFEGAEGVYLLSPPDVQARAFIADRKQLTHDIVDVLRKARVGHVVLLSSIAAQHDSGTGPIVTVHNVEQQLRAAELPRTFVRAAYFAENWASVLPVARAQGVLPTFIRPDLPVPTIAVRDIGPVAAEALLAGAPRAGERIIELAGPSEVSAAEIARVLGQVLGRTVQAQHAPLAAVAPTLTSFGISQNIAELFGELYAGLETGRVGWEGRGERVRGKTGIEAVLRSLLG